MLAVLELAFVLSYWMAAHSMQWLSNVSVDVPESVLAERYPRVKGGAWQTAS